MYIDQVTKSEKIDDARSVSILEIIFQLIAHERLIILVISRALLERFTDLNLPQKKMRNCFKKFVDFEEKHGTPETVEHAKQKALAFFADKQGQMDTS